LAPDRREIAAGAGCDAFANEALVAYIAKLKDPIMLTVAHRVEKGGRGEDPASETRAPGC